MSKEEQIAALRQLLTLCKDALKHLCGNHATSSLIMEIDELTRKIAGTAEGDKEEDIFL